MAATAYATAPGNIANKLQKVSPKSVFSAMFDRHSRRLLQNICRYGFPPVPSYVARPTPILTVTANVPAIYLSGNTAAWPAYNVEGRARVIGKGNRDPSFEPTNFPKGRELRLTFNQALFACIRKRNINVGLEVVAVSEIVVLSHGEGKIHPPN